VERENPIKRKKKSEGLQGKAAGRGGGERRSLCQKSLVLREEGSAFFMQRWERRRERMQKTRVPMLAFAEVV